MACHVRTSAGGAEADADRATGSFLSRKPVSVTPARNSGLRRMPTSRSRLVVTPWMRAPAKVAARRAAASDRPGAQAMTLASMAS